MCRIIERCATGLSVLVLSANANILVNGSFEAPFGGYRYVAGGSTVLPGWKTQLNGVEIVTDNDIGVGYSYRSSIQDGRQMVDLAPYVYKGGGISQTFSTTPGLSYEVNFFASSVQSFGKNGTGSLRVMVDSVVQNFDLNTRRSDFDWKPYQLSFVASGTEATLSFVSLSNPFTQFAAIDNVSVTQVPEAPVAILGLVGLVGFGAWQRRNGCRNSD